MRSTVYGVVFAIAISVSGCGTGALGESSEQAVAFSNNTSFVHMTGYTLDLRKVEKPSDIVGRLGVPLGSVVKVSGTVVEVKSKSKKSSPKQLRMTEVNGAKLDTPVTLEVFPRGSLDKPLQLKHGQRITVNVVERLMTYGNPRGYWELFQGARPGYHLASYVQILLDEEKSDWP